MNKTEIDRFEKLSGQLISVYEEMSLLSKKNPNDAVNKFKLKFVNKLIQEANEFLSKGYHPFDDFDCFDEDDIPHTSDVVFILSQYLQCFEKFRSDNVYRQGDDWYWKIKIDENDDVDENAIIGEFRTVKPKRLKD
jgi:hypothetical protein